MQDALPWIVSGAIAAVVLFIATLVVVANRRYARVVAHLRTHGIDSHARVVDARRSGVRVNNQRGWVLVLVWRHPDTGEEHALESDLVWRDNYVFDSVRANLKDIGELPVRIDPAAPEQFHVVDVSSLKQ